MLTIEEVAAIEARCRALFRWGDSICTDDICSNPTESDVEQINIVIRTDIPALIEDWKKMREALNGIANRGCCQTPGCSEDDPKCDAMEARAALTPGTDQPAKEQR